MYAIMKNQFCTKYLISMKSPIIENNTPVSWCIMVVVLLMLLPTAPAHSQDDNPENPKSFRDLFTEGGYHMEYGSFNLAVPVYLEAEKLEPDNANIQYRIGYSYNRFSDDKAVAIPYLLKAAKKATRNYDDLSFTEKNAPQQAYYELARAYHESDQLDSAISNYSSYAAILNKKHYMQEEVAKQLKMCNYAKEQMANPINAKITNLGDNINTEYGDYTPVVTAKGSMMIFTSRRKGSTGPENNLEFDNRYFEDIYISFNKEGAWSTPEQIGGGINTPDHDAVISLSADGQKLFTYNTEGGGDIYLSYRMGEGWTLPDRLGPTINTPARETHASITPDGRNLYFSSDRSDKNTTQYGGLDLYVATKLPTGGWSEATNLGDVVNTAGDDDAPFIHPNGKRLYFSSKGHKSMGGYDIFYSDLKDDGTWTTPANIGYPVNTTKDDIYYVESPDGKRAYYSSINAAVGYGRSDLYMIELPDRTAVPLTLLSGTMEVKMEDGIALESKIVVKDQATQEVLEYSPNTATGEYTIVLLPGSVNEISYMVEDSVIATEVIDEGATGYNEIVKVISSDGKIVTSGVDVAVTEPTTTEAIIQKLLLLDADGATVMTGEMNKDSLFAFTELPDMNNYIFKLDPTDGPMIESDVRVLAIVDGEEVVFALQEAGDGTFTFKSDEPVKATRVMVSSFTQYFGYNVKLIATDRTDYKQMIEDLAANSKQGYDQVVLIEASASKVPTTKYGTNEKLAQERGNKTKWVLSRSLENKGANLSNIKFEITPKVQGPNYNTDAIENREVYKESQYVKITSR